LRYNNASGFHLKGDVATTKCQQYTKDR